MLSKNIFHAFPKIFSENCWFLTPTGLERPVGHEEKLEEPICQRTAKLTAQQLQTGPEICSNKIEIFEFSKIAILFENMSGPVWSYNVETFSFDVWNGCSNFSSWTTGRYNPVGGQNLIMCCHFFETYWDFYEKRYLKASTSILVSKS